MSSRNMRQIEEIVGLLSSKSRYYWEMKINCPFCGAYTMLLKSGGKRGAHYYCLDCGREGSNDDLHQELLEKLIQKPRGVAL